MGVKSDSLKKQKQIVDFFERLMEENVNAPNVLASCGGIRKVETGYVFDLPSLHQAILFLKDVSYKAFKEAIYAGELNKTLAEKGLVVELYEPEAKSGKGKVDSNLYHLKKLN